MKGWMVPSSGVREEINPHYYLHLQARGCSAIFKVDDNELFNFVWLHWGNDHYCVSAWGGGAVHRENVCVSVFHGERKGWFWSMQQQSKVIIR